MVNTAMAKYDEMRQSEELMSWAEKAQQAEYIMQASLEDSRLKGKQEGLAEGKKAMLLTMLATKYGVEDCEWIETLQEEQLHTLAKNMFIYDNFTDLKKAINT